MQTTHRYKKQFASALDIRLIDHLTHVSNEHKIPKAHLFEEAVRLVLEKYSVKLDF